jgi:hypothetical protein
MKRFHAYIDRIKEIKYLNFLFLYCFLGLSVLYLGNKLDKIIHYIPDCSQPDLSNIEKSLEEIKGDLNSINQYGVKTLNY